MLTFSVEELQLYVSLLMYSIRAHWKQARGLTEPGGAPCWQVWLWETGIWWRGTSPIQKKKKKNLTRRACINTGWREVCTELSTNLFSLSLLCLSPNLTKRVVFVSDFFTFADISLSSLFNDLEAAAPFCLTGNSCSQLARRGSLLLFCSAPNSFWWF